MKANNAILPSALAALLPPGGKKKSREAGDQAALRWEEGQRAPEACETERVFSVQNRNYKDGGRFQEAAKELGRKFSFHC